MATAAPTPQVALQEVLLGNEVFVTVRNPRHFEAYRESQHPSVTMLTCCDARLHQLVFNFDPIDRTFVVQNIGNQLQPACGSVDYGIIHLKTPLLLILGHTNCGAIKAAMTDYREESREIVAELNGLHLPLLGDDPAAKFEDRWLRNVERNVDYQAEASVRRFRKLIDEGKLAVLGCVYDFVDIYGHGSGRILATNLNGETDPEKIKAAPQMAGLPEELRDVIVHRRFIPGR